MSQPDKKKEVRECCQVTSIRPVNHCEIWLLSSCSEQSIWWKINVCEVQHDWCNLFLYTAFRNSWTELVTNCTDKPSSGISDQTNFCTPESKTSYWDERRKVLLMFVLTTYKHPMLHALECCRTVYDNIYLRVSSRTPTWQMSNQ